MWRVGVAAALMIASMTRVANAQSIPATIGDAEAQGARLARADSRSAEQAYFRNSPFGGTADRRCVPASERNWAGSLRSGDFIIRGRLTGPNAFNAGEESGVLWLPLHGSSSVKPPLVVRAARVGSPADTVRFGVEHITHSAGGGSEPLYGYPSLVTFPSAGQWVVVATAGNDWGCFLLDVDPHHS